VYVKNLRKKRKNIGKKSTVYIKKLKNYVYDLPHKIGKLLAVNFKTILLHKFETRKIRSKKN
jgi:hypothetical protein